MSDDGWIKVHRKILSNITVMKDPEYFTVWMYLLLNATHKQMERWFKGEKRLLQPGQLLTGRKSISETCNISESKVQRILRMLENEHQIEQETSNKNRLITIVNWNEYQRSEQQTEQQLNNKRTTTEQQLNTNKNVKNVKNDKNDKNIINSITLDRPSGADPDNHNNANIAAAASDVEICFSNITGKVASLADKQAMQDAVSKYGQKHVISIMQRLAKRDVQINSFKYFLPAINEPKKQKKQQNMIKRDEININGENFEEILKRKQAEFLKKATEDLNERTGYTESN